MSTPQYSMPEYDKPNIQINLVSMDSQIIRDASLIITIKMRQNY